MRTKTTISLTAEKRVKLTIIRRELGYEYINAYVDACIRKDWDLLRVAGRVSEEQLKAALKADNHKPKTKNKKKK